MRISPSVSANSSTSGPSMCSASLRDRAVEAEPGLDRHGQQVERVGQLAADALLAAAGPHRDDGVRQEEARRRRTRSRRTARPRRSCRRPTRRSSRAAPTTAATKAFEARKLVGETRRPSPAASSLRLIESTVALGVSRSTPRASPVFIGSRARSRKPSPPKTSERVRERPYVAARLRACERSRAGWVATSPTRKAASPSVTTPMRRSSM